jgi:hypothetical protein
MPRVRPTALQEVLLKCVERLGSPGVAGSAARGYAPQLLEDVASLLRHGRPVAVCALHDMRRLVKQAAVALKRHIASPNGARVCGGLVGAVSTECSFTTTYSHEKKPRSRLPALLRFVLAHASVAVPEVWRFHGGLEAGSFGPPTPPLLHARRSCGPPLA